MPRPKSAPKSAAEQLADRLTTKTERVPPIPPDDFLSTGCTLLNLAFTGHPDRGVPKGNYLYLVGDSGAAKTWLSFCLFAEAARNPHFADYRFVHDNAENGALMDVATYFGQGVVDRLEPPYKGVVGSETAQQFYHHLEINCRRGPCVYILDSMDAINDDADDEKFEAELHHYETGEGTIPGSMGMAKAKTNSRNINRVVKSLRHNGSILVVISQTRDKVGGNIPNQKTRGGGRALKFYAHLEAWLSVRGAITKTYLRKDREIGSYIQVDVQKNRVCGWEGKMPLVNFIKGYGVDDVGSVVDYLIDERHWVKPKTQAPAGRGRKQITSGDDDDGGKVIAAPEFDFVGRRDALIQRIQDVNGERELGQIAARLWREIIAGAMPDRKPRYT